MGKLSKLIKGLLILLKKPYLLNNVIYSEEVFKEKVKNTYKLRQGLTQLDLKTLFPEFKVEVDPFAFLDGGSLPTDLALLKALAVKYNVKDYLEIGTWRGESVANVAAVVENCYTVNLPDEEMLKMNLPAEYVQSHRFFSEGLKNVKHIQAHSHSFDFGSLNTKFDMIFIDGDHHYESVKKDTQTAFNLLKSNASIIVWHDYAVSPETIRWDVMMGILDGCPMEKRKNIYHISNTLCAVYLKENFVASFLKPNALPDKKFKVTIEMEKASKVS